MKTTLTLCTAVAVGLYLLLSFAFDTLQKQSKAEAGRAEAIVSTLTR